tara:strand:- start:433550 stop:434269 length:720 start_codon:yes stop_codon:yes gene_type:complete
VQQYLEENKKRLTAQLSDEIEVFLQDPATQKLSVRLRKELENTSPLVALLPVNTKPLTDLSQERKLEFLHHLGMIYDDVKNNNPTGNKIYSASLAPPLPEKEATLLGNACATCMGACCGYAKTHAYLDYPSLKQILASRAPEFSEEELVELYSEYFPEQSYQDSCVFLGIEGCALPKELRSFICSNFLCDSLKSYRHNLLQTGATVTFAAAVQNHQIMYTSVYSHEDFIRLTEKQNPTV